MQGVLANQQFQFRKRHCTISYPRYLTRRQKVVEIGKVKAAPQKTKPENSVKKKYEAGKGQNNQAIDEMDISTVLMQLERQQDQLSTADIAHYCVQLKYMVDKGITVNPLTLKSVLQQLFKIILENLQKMSCQEITICMSSFGKISGKLNESNCDQSALNFVVHKLSQRALEFADEMDNASAAAFLRSAVYFEWKNMIVIEQIIEIAVKSTGHSFQPENIASNLWSLANISSRRHSVAKSFIDAITHFVELAKISLQNLQLSAISSILESLSKLKYYDKQLMFTVEHKILQKQLVFQNWKQVFNAILSFSSFGIQNKRVLKILMAMFRIEFKRVTHNNIFYICSLVNALAALNHELEDTQWLVNQVVDFNQQQINNDFKPLTFTQLNFLRSAQLYYMANNESLILPDSLQQQCIEVRQKVLLGKKERYDAKTDLLFALIAEKYEDCKKGVLIHNNETFIDAMIYCRGEAKVAIIKTYQGQYTINEPLCQMYQSKVNIDRVRKLGYVVLEVSMIKWKEPGYPDFVMNKIESLLNQKK